MINHKQYNNTVQCISVCPPSNSFLFSTSRLVLLNKKTWSNFGIRFMSHSSVSSDFYFEKNKYIRAFRPDGKSQNNIWKLISKYFSHFQFWKIGRFSLVSVVTSLQKCDVLHLYSFRSIHKEYHLTSYYLIFQTYILFPPLCHSGSPTYKITDLQQTDL